MRTFLKSLLLFASIFTAAYVARILIVPEVAPITEGEQSGWQLDVAPFLDVGAKHRPVGNNPGRAAGAIAPVQEFGHTLT